MNAENIQDQLDLEETTSVEVEAPKERLALLTKLLRHIGALVLIASALSFVLQGSFASLFSEYEEWSSIFRYLCFLLFGVILSGAGVFCAIRLKDDKGARTFLGLSVAFLPAHFSQIGALLYSLFDGNVDVPSLFLYKAPSTLSAMLVLGLALLVLIPTAFAGFSALARAGAKKLTLIYLFTNVLILIPTRDPSTVAFLGAGILLAALLFDAKYLSELPSLRNWEGSVARILPFIPFLIVSGRSLFLHSTNDMLLSTVFAATSLFFFVMLPRTNLRRDIASFAQGFSLIFVAIAWSFFIQGVFFHPNAPLHIGDYAMRARMGIPLFYYPLAFIFFAMSFFSLGTGRNFRRAGAGLAVLSSFAQLAFHGGLPASFTTVVFGILALVAAFAMEERTLFYLGAAGLAIGLLYHLRYALDLYTLSPWLSLAITGTLIVLSSSYLENYSQKLLGICADYRDKLGRWA